MPNDSFTITYEDLTSTLRSTLTTADMERFYREIHNSQLGGSIKPSGKPIKKKTAEDDEKWEDIFI